MRAGRQVISMSRNSEEKKAQGVAERMSKVASFRFIADEKDFLLITVLPKDLLSGELGKERHPPSLLQEDA